MATPAPVPSMWRATREQIAALCKKYALYIQMSVRADIDAAQLMWAFALNESIHENGGILHFPPRFEAAYAPGGRYCVGQQVQAYTHYGRDAACSFGPWQVMFQYCAPFQPIELSDLETCAKVFTKYIRNQMATKPPEPTVELPIMLVEIAKAYNHGNWKDTFDDSQYQGRFLLHYAEAMPL